MALKSFTTSDRLAVRAIRGDVDAGGGGWGETGSASSFSSELAISSCAILFWRDCNSSRCDCRTVPPTIPFPTPSPTTLPGTANLLWKAVSGATRLFIKLGRVIASKRIVAKEPAPAHAQGRPFSERVNAINRAIGVNFTGADGV